MLVYANPGARGAFAGVFWVGCMGVVDAGCGVVRMVAGVVDGSSVGCQFVFCLVT